MAYFLERLYSETLPISKQTYQEMRDILLMKALPEYTLSGKTGLVVATNKKDIGWFVGCEGTMSRKEFLALRQTVSLLALKELDVVEE